MLNFNKCLFYIYYGEKQWITSRSFLVMKSLYIPRTCLHWLLSHCRCQYRVNLKREDQEKIFLPPCEKMHSSGLKKGSESAISVSNYTDFGYSDSPRSRSWIKVEIIGPGPILPLNSVILETTRGKSNCH